MLPDGLAEAVDTESKLKDGKPTLATANFGLKLTARFVAF